MSQVSIDLKTFEKLIINKYEMELALDSMKEIRSRLINLQTALSNKSVECIAACYKIEEIIKHFDSIEYKIIL